MMKESTIELLLILVFVISSCEKTEINDNINNDKSSDFVIGNKENMIINNYDTLISHRFMSSTQNLKFNIDINNDGVDDIQFISEVGGSQQGTGPIPESKIKCLNDGTKIYGLYIADTLFMNKDTVLMSHDDGTCDVVYSSNLVCNRINDLDSVIQSTNIYIVSALDSGDIFSNDVFSSPSLSKLNGISVYYPLDYLSISGDTTYWKGVSSHYDCNDFPLDEIKYLGVKIGERYAWIRIMISDKSEIYIYESAIESAE